MTTFSRAMVAMVLLSAVIVFGRVASPDASIIQTGVPATTIAAAAK